MTQSQVTSCFYWRSFCWYFLFVSFAWHLAISSIV